MQNFGLQSIVLVSKLETGVELLVIIVIVLIHLVKSSSLELIMVFPEVVSGYQGMKIR